MKFIFCSDGSHVQLYKHMLALKEDTDRLLLELIRERRFGVVGSSRKFFNEDDITGGRKDLLKRAFGKFIDSDTCNDVPFCVYIRETFLDETLGFCGGKRLFWEVYTGGERLTELRILLGEKVLYDEAFECLTGSRNAKLSENQWRWFLAELEKMEGLRAVYE